MHTLSLCAAGTSRTQAMSASLLISARVPVPPAARRAPGAGLGYGWGVLPGGAGLDRIALCALAASGAWLAQGWSTNWQSSILNHAFSNRRQSSWLSKAQQCGETSLPMKGKFGTDGLTSGASKH